jgi:hypothetical protein
MPRTTAIRFISVSIQVLREQHAAILLAASKNGISSNELVRNAIEAYPPVRDALRKLRDMAEALEEISHE